MAIKKICERCEFFKTRQGKGTIGECRFNPPTLMPHGESCFPDTESTHWCGRFEINTDKYREDGRKIYTRTDTTMHRPNQSGGGHAE